MKKKNIHKINSLSIVIPFYNEKKRLNLAFKNINIFLKKNITSQIEILFVDDGSDDEGYIIIKNFFNGLQKSKNLSYKLIRVKKNCGKGFALKKGCLAAKKEWILTTDLDFSVPLTQINLWIKKRVISIDNYIFFGSRALESSKVKTAKHRLLIGKIFRVLISFFLNIKIKDTQCGFKLYKNQIAKKIFRKLTMYGFDHDLEIVILAKKINQKIEELPVKWHHVGQSKLHLFKDSIKMFLGILKLSAKI